MACCFMHLLHRLAKRRGDLAFLKGSRLRSSSDSAPFFMVKSTPSGPVAAPRKSLDSRFEGLHKRLAKASNHRATVANHILVEKLASDGLA